MRRIALFTLAACVPATCLFADFSYDQTSKITGGAMAGMMKFAGAFSKQAREPMTSTVAIKGDRMVHINQRQATVTDLGKETITTINFEKKTYTVMTFAQMKEMMEHASERMSEAREKAATDPQKADVNFKVSMKDTGQKRQIAGYDAHEVIMTLEMEGTDKQSGNKGGMTMTSDMWLAPKIAGYDEVRDFHRRMALKLNWTPGGAMPMMGRPDMAKGMAEMMKEGAKMDGIPVLQVVKMGGHAEGVAPAENTGSNSNSEQQQQQQQADRPTPGGALAGALGGRFGLGRKKNQSDSGSQDASSGNSAPPPSGDASASLMEMTMETTNLSSAPVDGSKFEVPAGFKQVEPEMMQRRKR